jgi:hypothetical protein
MPPGSFLTLASLFSGFGVTVLMFRIRRELEVRESDPDQPNWLAWADYLVMAAILLSLLFVVLPLTAPAEPGPRAIALARGACSAAAILLAAYPFAILAHYRIELGAQRLGERRKGEPIEKAFVIGAALVAVVVLGSVVASGW